MRQERKAWTNTTAACPKPQSTISLNRGRREVLLAAKFSVAALDQADVEQLLSNDLCSVDGTLIEAWTSMRRFRRRDDEDKPPSPGRNGEHGLARGSACRLSPRSIAGARF
jgi:hypothetical protein